MDPIFFVSALAALLCLNLYLHAPLVRGAIGERRVNKALRRVLALQADILLCDLTLRTRRGTTQVDHVVLSKHAIFVIETKNMSGWIFGGERQARWTQTLPRRKSQFQNPLRQNYQHVKVIQDLLGVAEEHIENIVVFVGSARPKTKMPNNVYWSKRALVRHIQRRLRSDTKDAFSQAQIERFAQTLRQKALDNTKATRRAHIKYLKTQARQTNAVTGTCPRCGTEMVARKNKNTGDAFWGCSTFPKCRAIRREDRFS